VIDEDG